MPDQQDQEVNIGPAAADAVDREQNIGLSTESLALTVEDAEAGDRESPFGNKYPMTWSGYGTSFPASANFPEAPAESGFFPSDYNPFRSTWSGHDALLSDGALGPWTMTEPPPKRVSFSGISGVSTPTSEPTDWSGTHLSSRKRTRRAAFSEDPAEPTGPKKSSKTDNDEEEERLTLACPFQKRQPLKHRKCLKYELRRIKDVKQHIYRRHTQPEYYCARCYTTFDSSTQRDDHARLPACDVQPVSAFEGVSEVQRQELRKSSLRRLSVVEQWFEIWEVIFTDEPKPQSIYRGDQLEQMAPLLRDLWRSRRSGILTQLLPQDSADEATIQPLVEEVMQAFFDSLEAETGSFLPKDE